MDFPILAFQHVGKVSDLALFSGGGSLDIRGRDFTGAAAILINGYKSPTFVVISDTRVLADVPQSQFGVPIRTVSVLRTTTANSENTVISFEAAVPSMLVTPQTYLVQRVLKILLTTPGTDIFRPSSGGGLLSVIGPTPIDPSAAHALVSLRIQSGVREIISSQTASGPISAEQRLSGVDILSVEYSPGDTSLDVRIRIISANGTSVVAGVAL